MPAPQRTARIEDDIWDPAQTRAKTEGASLGALMRAAIQRYASGDLTSNAEPASQPRPELTSRAQAASQGTAVPIAAIGTGEPSPGVVCMGPGCWQRDTSPVRPPQAPALPRLRRRSPGPHLPAGDTAERSTPHPPRRGLTASIDSLSRLREHPV